MGKSFFSYHISRNYPFRWFTPVAVVGGITLTVLFSLINYVLTGFELVPYTLDQPPTGQSTWYHRLSALQPNLEANCTPVDVPVNTQFFTNHSGLTYTLSAVWNDDDGKGKVAYSSGLNYYNEVFRNCSVYLIQVEMEELDRTANQVNSAAWGQVVRAFTTCSVKDKTGRITHINLTATYETVPPSYSAFTGPQGFITTNRETLASLWWGQSLLSAWWANVSSSLIYATNNNGTPPFLKGLIEWVPNSEGSPDITDPSFFFMTYNLVKQVYGYNEANGTFVSEYEGDFYNIVPNTDIKNPGEVTDLIANGNSNFTNGSVILFGADKLARSMYSAVMVDLGQEGPASSNVLLQDKALQTFSSGVAFTSFPWVNFVPGPATGDYDALKGTTGKLGTSPSVISTKYTCQIPTRKPAGPLILSILVADLVFLQTAWSIYTFVAGLLLQEKDKPSYCEGCLKQMGTPAEGVPLERLETPLLSKIRLDSSRYVPLNGTDEGPT